MNDVLTDIEYLLRRNWGALWPDAKLFATAFLVLYGRSPVVRRVKDMAVELGVSDRLVTRACRELEQAGFLSRRPHGTPSNRPSFEYQLTGALLGRIREAGKRHPASASDLILKVVTSERRKGRKPGRTVDSALVAAEARRADAGGTDALDVSERLLLMTLLAHANVAGSVHGYGFRDLSRLTGMSKPRVQSAMMRLRQKGLLRAFVPGASPGRIFHCAPGAYFLNLQHPVYGGLGRFSHMLVYDLRSEQRGEGNEAEGPSVNEDDAVATTSVSQELREAHQLLAVFARLRDIQSDIDLGDEAALSEGHRLIYVRTGYLWGQVNLSLNKELQELAPLFDDRKRPYLADYLQMKLEEYAADLLTHHWVSLKSLTYLVMEERIWREAFGTVPDGERQLSKPEQLQLRAVQVLFALARGMAESIQQVMMATSSMANSMVHSLLPDVVDGPREQFVVVSAYPSALRLGSECRVTLVQPWHRLSRLRVFRRCTYDQLTLQELHDLGLLSVSEEKGAAVGGET